MRWNSFAIVKRSVVSNDLFNSSLTLFEFLTPLKTWYKNCFICLSSKFAFKDPHQRGRHEKSRFADLRSAYLRFADLRFADSRFADLRFADSRFAYLRSADLRSAFNATAISTHNFKFKHLKENNFFPDNLCRITNVFSIFILKYSSMI